MLILILLQKYCDTNGSRVVIHIGGACTAFCQEEGILLQKILHSNEVYRDTFQKYQGRLDSPELLPQKPACSLARDIC